MGARYLYNLARTFMVELGIKAKDVSPPPANMLSPITIYERAGERLKKKVKRMKDETLGRIVASGRRKEPFYELPVLSPFGTIKFFNTSLSPASDPTGREIMEELAIRTIVAKMFDILNEPPIFVPRMSMRHRCFK